MLAWRAGAAAAGGRLHEGVGREIGRARGQGEPLPSAVRGEVEAAMGADLGGVRVHTGARADVLARALSARAFASGRDLFFRAGEFRPESTSGRRVLAHELAHAAGHPHAPSVPTTLGAADDAHEAAAEQAERAVDVGDAPSAAPSGGDGAVRRKLLMEGDPADVNTLLTLLGDAAGLVLSVAGKQVSQAPKPPPAPGPAPAPGPGVTAGAASGASAGKAAAPAPAPPPTSAALAAFLKGVIADQKQDAEVVAGQGQKGVTVGAFPMPHDLSKEKKQHIDVDDVVALNRRVPRWGTAGAAHEIDENYRGHALHAQKPGADVYLPSHFAAIETESDVSQELKVGAGRRIADSMVEDTPTETRRAFDWSDEYRLMRIESAAGNWKVTNAWKSARVKVNTYTVTGFGNNDAMAPGSAWEVAAKAAADMKAAELSTAQVEGHVEAGEKEEIGLRRAEGIRDIVVGQASDRLSVKSVHAVNGKTAGGGGRSVSIAITRPATPAPPAGSSTAPPPPPAPAPNPAANPKGP
jgi:hypothetical protein